MPPNDPARAETFRAIRAFLGLSLTDIAHRVGYRTRDSIWRMEQGKVRIPAMVYEKMLDLHTLALDQPRLWQEEKAKIKAATKAHAAANRKAKYESVTP